MSHSLDELVMFVEVVECGSFSAAAAKLELSTSVVSKRVKALEERLATQLLLRTTRKLSMTEAGEQLFDSLRHVPALVRDAEERVRDSADKVEGPLRVVLPTYFDSGLLQERLVPAYMAAHPAVDLSMTIVANPMAHLGEEYDLLVAGKLPTDRFPDTSMISRRLLKLRGALFATPEYLERHGSPAHPDELIQHDCLSYLNQDWHFTTPEGEVLLIGVSGSLRTNSNQLLRAATLTGKGIAYSFPVFIAEDVTSGRVVRVLDAFTAGSYIDIHVFYPATRFLPRRTRTFIDALVEHFSSSTE